METFAEVRNHMMELYELKIDEPFIISFEFPIQGGDRRQLTLVLDAEDQFDEDELVQRLTEFREGLREKYDVGLTLKERLETAVADEDYELAAELRDELSRRPE